MFVSRDRPLCGARPVCSFWVFIVPCFGSVLALVAGFLWHLTSLLTDDRGRMLAVVLLSFDLQGVSDFNSGFLADPRRRGA